MKCKYCKRTIDEVVEQDREFKLISGEPFICNRCREVEEYKQWLNGVRKMLKVDELEAENQSLRKELFELEGIKQACEKYGYDIALTTQAKIKAVERQRIYKEIMSNKNDGVEEDRVLIFTRTLRDIIFNDKFVSN